ncbi:MAG TPA: hypothetical protein VK186_06890 [Candidatus Deferrimicrobium sp.]|nr:hypothetical protein [Candidatus Deferrimicrobium sp.]
MIDVTGVKDIIGKHFGDCLETIGNISRDTDNKKVMVDMQERFHCYDTIVQGFYQGKAAVKTVGDENPRSPDMILFKMDSICFVEFKNGKLDKDKIKVKAIEGGVIAMHEIVKKYSSFDVGLSDIINLDKSFVLVYNDKKNPSIDADVVDDDTSSEKGKRYKTHVRAIPVRLGLGIYKNKFFKEIKIYSPANFKKWFKKEEFLPA